MLETLEKPRKLASMFAEALRAALIEKGKTKYRVAEDSGVSEGMLSRYAKGERVPSDETIDRIAAVLALDPEPFKAAAAADRLGVERARQVAELIAPGGDIRDDQSPRFVPKISVLDGAASARYPVTDREAAIIRKFEAKGLWFALPPDFFNLPPAKRRALFRSAHESALIYAETTGTDLAGLEDGA